MLINPIIIIFSAAILVFAVIFCILNKPKKPVLSGFALLILVFFLSCTYMIYLMFAALENQSFQIDFVEKIVRFITANDIISEISLEKSFDVFKTIDIIMIVLSIVFLLYDVNMIFLKNDEKHTPDNTEINTHDLKGNNTVL